LAEILALASGRAAKSPNDLSPQMKMVAGTRNPYTQLNFGGASEAGMCDGGAGWARRSLADTNSRNGCLAFCPLIPDS
jgi:hypothetical protein